MKNPKTQKRILLVGGGTGGHLLPLKNLADFLAKKGAKVAICASDAALDRQLCEQNFAGFQTYFLPAGKIRRYFSVQNFFDGFKIIGSVFRARKVLKDFAPDILFFKGGFVSAPVLLAAKIMGFDGQIFSHDSDASISKMGEILKKNADRSFWNFEKNGVGRLFFSGEKVKKRVKNMQAQILIFGGSQGSAFLNKIFEQNAGKILEKYSVIIISGLGNKIKISKKSNKNFEQFEILSAQKLSEKIEESDGVVCRASSAIFQVLAAKKPALVIPLPSAARNHQKENADYFAAKKLIKIFEQKKSNEQNFCAKIDEMMTDSVLKKRLEKVNIENDAEKIGEIILSFAPKKLKSAGK